MPLSYELGKLRAEVVRKINPQIMYRPDDTSIYFVGSTSTAQRESFNAALSDVDLLIVPTCDSLADYVNHFKQAMRVNLVLNQPDDSLVETFMMSSRIAYSYFKILPVIAGGREIQKADEAYVGKDSRKAQYDILPTTKTRRNLYLAKALRFQREYTQLLPVADTSKARKVAARILRGLKIIICASCPLDELASMEQKLSSITTFKGVEKVFLDVLNTDFSVDDMIQRLLDGERVYDWPAWMRAQEAVAYRLLELKLEQVFTPKDHRLYEGMSQVRDLLNRKLKDILGCGDEKLQLILIDDYVDEAASVISKLAIAGVRKLASFEGQDTPEIVLDGYDMMVEHLKGEARGRLDCLAAAVVLLEYAFEQSIDYANKQ